MCTIVYTILCILQGKFHPPFQESSFMYFPRKITFPFLKKAISYIFQGKLLPISRKHFYVFFKENYFPFQESSFMYFSGKITSHFKKTVLCIFKGK